MWTLTQGVVIDQRFLLGRVVRESAVALVYEAKHRNGADAWIKLPRGREHAAALAHEAQVANALGASAVKIRDDGVTEDGLPYLVLEPVSGQRLDEWLQRSGGRAPPSEAMAIGDDLCSALATMHRAGYSVGVLRSESIVVVPKGGVCLVELEHARPGTAAGIKDDVTMIGRVLYEMLSGAPFVALSPPLAGVMPQLPRALTAAVDDAARGRLGAIHELRGALLVAIAEGAAPPRRPIPSAPPVMDTLELTEIVLPRSSKSLFDPGELTGIRSRPSIPGAPGSSGPDLRGAASNQSRSSTTAFTAPSTSNVRGESVAQRGPRQLVVAGGVGAVLLVGAVAIVLGVAVKRKEAAGRAEAATAAVAAVPPLSSSSAPEPPPSAAAAVAAPAASTVAPGPVSPVATTAAKSGDTSFRFEGDLSPRLVIVDGVVSGTTKKPVRTRCGTHSVKIGGKGVARSLDLPCGGEQVIAIEANGTWHAR